MDHFLRPVAKVLPESAVVPDENLIQPPPTQFTHEIIAQCAYYYSSPRHDASADGTFPVGTRVVLLSHDGGAFGRVVDGRGLSVIVPIEKLSRLPKGP